MKRLSVLLALFCAIVGSQGASSAVLVEEGGKSVTSAAYSVIAGDGLGFHQQRKVGMGIAGAGPWGVLGAHLEFNFSSDISMQTGIGLGSGFQTFALQIRKFIPGKWFLPYMGAGLARWYTAGDGDGAVNETTPGFLGKRFLDAKEKRTGRFSEILLTPTLGIQYLQLKGEWAGSTLFAEFNLLIDVDDLVLGPTGSLGYSYFF